MTVTDHLSIRTRTVFILLSLIGLVLYLNSLQAPFHFDDTYYVKENLSIKSSSSILDRFGTDIHGLLRGRPLLLFTFLVNYKLGGLDTFGYHLVNLLVHIGTAFFVYLLLARHAAPSVDPDQGYSPTALLAAVLFLVHPINTESVTYLSSRSSELSGFFVVLSMYCFFRATEQRFHARWYALCVLAFFAGLMTKEAAIVLPALLLLFDYSFVARGATGFRLRWRYHAPLALLSCFLFAFYISLVTMQPSAEGRPWLTHVLTELRVFTHYLRLLAVPVGLNIDHDVAASHHLDGRSAFAMLLLLLLITAAWIFRKKQPLLSFALSWFFLCVSPFLFLRLNDFMAERWLYLASIGYCAGLAGLLMAVSRHRRKTGIALIAAVLMLGGFLTIRRNQVYASPVALWEDAARQSPAKYRPLLNLSSAYMENGDPERAIVTAEGAIRLWKEQGRRDRDIVIATINLAAAQGSDVEKAGALLRSVEKEASLYPEYYGVLGVVHMNAGAYPDAIKAFEQALARSPRSASFLFILGKCHERTGRKETARTYFERATQVIPQNAQEFMAQGEAYSMLGNFPKASARFHEAVRTDPLDVAMRIYYASILLANGHLDNAFGQFLTASKISPRHAPAYKGMGLVMLARGNGKEARIYFEKSLTLLPPGSPESRIVEDLRIQTLDR